MEHRHDAGRRRIGGWVFWAVWVLSGPLLLADAPTPAGLVVAVRGEVTITPAGGAARPVVLKDEVRQHDTLRTGARGRLQICFEDDTILSLGRNTQIEISEFVFKPSDGQGAMSLNISEGVFRVVGGIIMKIAPENFRAETPTATIGIRGSSFAAEATASRTRVVLLGTTGAGITVSNDDGYRIVYIPGTGVAVALGQAPGPVRSMDAVAAALLGQTSVGGAGAAPGAEGGSGGGQDDGAAVDPQGLIPGYRTETEARLAVAEEPPDGSLPMGDGTAIGLDLANGWALRTLSPDEVAVTVGLEDGRPSRVESGGMVLHAPGTSNSADTFPDGPATGPGLLFTFTDGRIAGNSAVAVSRGSIVPVGTDADIETWGQWEMDIADPNGTASHRVVGLWQATSLARTATEVVRGLLLGADFTGSYRGSAHCLRNGAERFDGTARFDLDFRNNAFTGAMDFAGDGGPAMDVAGSIGEDGVQGRVTTIHGDSAVRSSSLRGAFHGETGQSLQGAFDAQSAANRYIGIFATSRRESPPKAAPRP